MIGWTKIKYSVSQSRRDTQLETMNPSRLPSHRPAVNLIIDEESAAPLYAQPQSAPAKSRKRGREASDVDQATSVARARLMAEQLLWQVSGLRGMLAEAYEEGSSDEDSEYDQAEEGEGGDLTADEHDDNDDDDDDALTSLESELLLAYKSESEAANMIDELKMHIDQRRRVPDSGSYALAIHHIPVSNDTST